MIVVLIINLTYKLCYSILYFIKYWWCIVLPTVLSVLFCNVICQYYFILEMYITYPFIIHLLNSD